jgi:hypothetical protein
MLIGKFILGILVFPLDASNDFSCVSQWIEAYLENAYINFSIQIEPGISLC